MNILSPLHLPVKRPILARFADGEMLKFKSVDSFFLFCQKLGEMSSSSNKQQFH